MTYAIADLPCWKCQAPQAADVRHLLGQCGELEDMQRSPTSGLPIGCCRIRSSPIPLGASPPLR